MRYVKLLALSFLAGMFFSCNGGSPERFSILTDGNKKQFRFGEEIKVDIRNPKNVKIESVVYSINGRELKLTDGKIKIDPQLLGKQELQAMVRFDGKSESVIKKITVLSDTPPVLYTYEIINEYPHDISAYTQGLEFNGDTLYEGTGRNGQSSLRKLDYRNGKVLKKVDLNDTYFGEGITILNNKVYQLTWQNNTGYVYDLESFEKLSTFAYNKSKEGWGLCNDGKKLFKSDGTEKIWILNPETLVEERYIQTVTNSSIFSKANELEYVNGKIYANSYQKDGVMIINPNTGAIEGVVDFRGLKSKVAKHDDLDVLNGIAYHKERQSFFVTGKNWNKLFEVRIIKK
ncbi:glutaminyl-peptide cyclotransferase [Leptobacterium flavescens]|uniref:Glutaminyl-peptide cyclotransferase n=1 Tax=Leptobacterium flavescens TaxID=472055 RepID=A0A6P0UND0_9FLAO|nr:glutaminyl-peptide cyclotransferase [Leptobacterium flavescens]NER13349.1 glutaminyl-peptide cyclotransferase [Leptobacterium flavescens]